MKNFILFKTECNEKIGFGHLKRCINFSKQFSKSTLIYFLLNENNIVKKILHYSKIKNISFFKNYNQKLDNKFLQKFSKYKKIMIYDSYKLKQKIIDRDLKVFDKVGYIDDIGKNFISDFVINYSIEKNKYKYRSKKIFLGKKYLPLQNLDLKKGKSIQSYFTILFTFGALDHYNLSKKLFINLNKISKNLKFIIIIGAFYKNKKGLIKFLNNFNNVKIVISPYDIQKYINNADLIICAGGMTVYEAILLNKKIISIQLWENQKNTALELNYDNLEILKFNRKYKNFLSNFKNSFIRLKKSDNRCNVNYLKKIVKSKMLSKSILKI